MAQNLYDQWQTANRYAMLGDIGRGMLGAYAGGMPLGRGLAYGLGQARTMDPFKMMAMRDYLAEKQAEENRASKATEIFGGYDPKTDVTWETGRQPEAKAMLGSMPEGARAMLGAMPPDQQLEAGYDYLTRPPGESWRTVDNPEAYGLPKGTVAQVDQTGKLKVLYNPVDTSDRLTALQKDVPYIAKLFGISEKDAAQMKLDSKSKGYDAYRADVGARLLPYVVDPQEAYDQATEFADLMFGRTQPPAPETPEAERQRGVFSRIFGGMFGREEGTPAGAPAEAMAREGAEARPEVRPPPPKPEYGAPASGVPAPRAAPSAPARPRYPGPAARSGVRSETPISEMDAAQLADLLANPEALTEADRIAIDERLTELGF